MADGTDSMELYRSTPHSNSSSNNNSFVLLDNNERSIHVTADSLEQEGKSGAAVNGRDAENGESSSASESVRRSEVISENRSTKFPGEASEWRQHGDAGGVGVGYDGKLLDSKLPPSVMEKVQFLVRENDSLKSTLHRNNDMLREKLTQAEEVVRQERQRTATYIQQVQDKQTEAQETESQLHKSRVLLRSVQNELSTEKLKNEELTRRISALELQRKDSPESAEQVGSEEMTSRVVQLNVALANKTEELTTAFRRIESLELRIKQTTGESVASTRSVQQATSQSDTGVVSDAEVDGRLAQERYVPYGTQITPSAESESPSEESPRMSQPSEVSRSGVNSWHMIPKAQSSLEHDGEIQKLKEKIAIRDEAIENLNEQVSVLKGDVDKRLEPFMLERRQMTAKLLETKQKLDVTVEKLHTLEAANAEKPADHAKADVLVEGKKKEHDDLSETLRQIRLDRDLLKVRNESLLKHKADAERLQSELVHLEGQISNKNEQVDYLVAQLNEAKTTVHEGVQQRHSDEGDVRSASDTTATANEAVHLSRIEQLENKLKERDNTVDSAKAQMSALQQQLQGLEQERRRMADLKKQLQEKVLEVEVLKQNHKQQVDESNRLRNDLDRAREDVSAAMKEKAKVEAHLHMKSEEANDLRRELEKAEQDLKLGQHVAARDESMSKLQNEVRAL